MRGNGPIKLDTLEIVEMYYDSPLNLKECFPTSKYFASLPIPIHSI
jgi:hypothetical protein